MERKFAVLVVAMVCAGAVIMPSLAAPTPSCLAGLSLGECCSGEINCANVASPPPECNRTDVNQFSSLTDGGCLCVAGNSSCAESCQSCKAYPTCLAGVTSGQCCSGEIDCSRVTNPPAQCDRNNIAQFNSLTDRGCLCVAGKDSCGQYCQSCKAYTTPPTPPTLPSCLAGVALGQCCSGEISCANVTNAPPQCNRTNIDQFNSLTDGGCLCVAGTDSCGQYCQSCKAYRADGGA